MTTNNEVKAPRPCTLWGQTFDSNTVEEVNAIHDHVYICLPCKLINSPFLEDPSFIQRMLFEAIQVIASAQRPWLKAEGFQFLEATPYYFLRENRTFEMLSFWNDEFHPCNSTGALIYSEDCSEWWESEYRDNYHISDFVAFKPISDSQEAWDAVAGVEVAEVCV